jgi:hypothetical protein
MSSSLRPFPSAHSQTRAMLNFLVVPRAFAIDAKAHGTIRYPFFIPFTGSEISRPVKGFLNCGDYLVTLPNHPDASMRRFPLVACRRLAGGCRSAKSPYYLVDSSVAHIPCVTLAFSHRRQISQKMFEARRTFGSGAAVCAQPATTAANVIPRRMPRPISPFLSGFHFLRPPCDREIS